MKYLLILLPLFLLSCNPSSLTGSSEEKTPLKFFLVEQKDLNHLINEKALPANPNLNSDKTLLNRDYPIEVALYNDGKWYYDLPNLDSGTGTWKYEGGMIKLYAERILFDMYIEVVAIEKGAEKVALKFTDRFGPRSLPSEKVNQ
jgi:hypothetical protein